MCVDIKGNIPVPFIKCLKTLECSYSVYTVGERFRPSPHGDV